nr:MAG: phosphoprotein [Wenzhou rodent rhabdovirus 1]
MDQPEKQKQPMNPSEKPKQRKKIKITEKARILNETIEDVTAPEGLIDPDKAKKLEAIYQETETFETEFNISPPQSDQRIYGGLVLPDKDTITNYFLELPVDSTENLAKAVLGHLDRLCNSNTEGENLHSVGNLVMAAYKAGRDSIGFGDIASLAAEVANFRKETNSTILELKQAITHISAQLADLQIQSAKPVVKFTNRDGTYIKQLGDMMVSNPAQKLGIERAKLVVDLLPPSRDIVAELQDMNPQGRIELIKSLLPN